MDSPKTWLNLIYFDFWCHIYLPILQIHRWISLLILLVLLLFNKYRSLIRLIFRFAKNLSHWHCDLRSSKKKDDEDDDDDVQKKCVYESEKEKIRNWVHRGVYFLVFFSYCHLPIFLLLAALLCSWWKTATTSLGTWMLILLF